MRIILAGTIGRSGLGGQAWASLQYLLGFRSLGHEVWYLEDCGDTSYAYDWEEQEWTYELDYPAGYVGRCLEPFGFANHWIYRTDDRAMGLPLPEFNEVCASADLLIARAAPLWVWRPEYNLPRRRAYIDVDPGFTQISIANGDAGLTAGITRCERRFTLAQRIGEPGCSIPNDGGPWLKTAPPVALDEWPVVEEEANDFTSVMRWQGFREAKHEGIAYGQRDQEFPKYFEMPSRTNQAFNIALMGTPPETLTQHGWNVTPGEALSRTPQSYRKFIRQSRAEFSVPKQGYVAMRGGWFSDRSVCYLASGRPVLMEDTGLQDRLPTGRGLVTFHDLDSAVSGVLDINDNYQVHREAARAIAESCFDAKRVLPDFLESAMN